MLLMCVLVTMSTGSAQLMRAKPTYPRVMVGMAGVTENTAIGKYRRYVYDQISSTWMPNVKAHIDTLAQGVVQISFVIHQDGTVTDMDVLLGDDRLQLKAACEQAITEHAPYRQFDSPIVEGAGKITTERLFVTFTAENDPQHSQQLIAKLKADIPVLTTKLKELRQYDQDMRRRLDETIKWKDREAISSSTHYNQGQTNRDIAKLDNQLRSDKWELEYFEPPPEKPAPADVTD
jgi:hypothetical protein